MVLPHLLAMLLATASPDGRALRTAIDSPAVRLDAAQVKARLSASKGEAPPDLSAVDLSGLDLRGVAPASPTPIWPAPTCSPATSPMPSPPG